MRDNRYELVSEEKLEVGVQTIPIYLIKTNNK